MKVYPKYILFKFIARNKIQPVEPVHQCSFECNLCGWTNDQSSWETY